MITTLNYSHNDAGHGPQTLRYCQSTKLLSAHDKSRTNRLIADPVRVEMYGILLKQQSCGVASYFGGCRIGSIYRETEDVVLIEELFKSSSKRNLDVANDDLIVADNFVKSGFKTNFATPNVSNPGFRDFHEVKNDKVGFDQLIKSKYQAYKQNFEATSEGTPNQPLKDLSNIDRPSQKLYFSFVEHVQQSSQNTSFLQQNSFTSSSYTGGMLSSSIQMPLNTNTTVNDGIYDQGCETKIRKDTVSTYDSCNKTNVDREMLDSDAFTKKKAFARVLSSRCFFEKGGYY